MRNLFPFLLCFTINCLLSTSCKQPSSVNYNEEQKEIRAFMDYYAQLIQRAKFDSVALLYVNTDFISSGMGNQEIESIDTIKAFYARMPKTPVDFRWEKMRIDILSKDAALVTSLFYWHNQNEKDTTKESYTGVFLKSPLGWRIKHEHESPDIEMLSKLIRESAKEAIPKQKEND